MFSRKKIAVTAGIALFVLLIVAASVFLRPMFGYPGPINYARWLVWSRSYKAAVLAQPYSANEELRHIEWDYWGWAGMDTTVYLVFDPTDSLSQAASSRQPGKYSGIPCKVFLVRRLENHWYTVWFYTNYVWGQPSCR
jgi:hypothetical protein